MPQLRALDPDVLVILLTGHGTIDLAVRAIKEGADQFLTKPADLQTLAVIVRRLVDVRRSRTRERARETRQTRRALDPFLGTSARIRRLAEECMRVAQADSPVLILGETGSGKGVLARWLHQHGPRANEALVDLNCAGLSRELVESELFGHEKGAFTGAVAVKRGLLEVAHRGTVFLDEIGDIDLTVQPRLLKVLEEKRFHRIGEVRERHVDLRLIAATHQNLVSLVREKRFRSDLYYRINTFTIELPPLRERAEDVPLLAARVLADVARDMGRGEVGLDPRAVDALSTYAWPGNLRELHNTLERALLLTDRRLLSAEDLRFEPGGGAEATPPPSTLTLAELERAHIARVLAEEHGRIEQAAARLGIPRSSLYVKVKKLGLGPVRP
jgi:DNA-binding NtrC family response regulator